MQIKLFVAFACFQGKQLSCQMLGQINGQAFSGAEIHLNLTQ